MPIIQDGLPPHLRFLHVDKRPSVITTKLMDKEIRAHARLNMTLSSLATPIDYKTVTTLKLDYQNILRIDHLWILSNLEILSLSSNLIEKIENLNTLVKLTHLNLSFNKIRVIENLEELKELLVLSLFNNLIETVTSLDHNQKLQVLSLGENQIADKESVVYLRKLKNLNALNLEGNPCTKLPRFEYFVLAYIPQLSYLNNVAAKSSTKQLAREAFGEGVAAVERKELELITELEEQEKVREEAQLLYDACVDGLEGEDLYQAFMEDDDDGHALVLMSSKVQEVFDKLKYDLRNMSKSLFQHGLEQLEIRQAEDKRHEEEHAQILKRKLKHSRTVTERFAAATLQLKNEIVELLDIEGPDGAELIRAFMDQQAEKARQDALAGLASGTTAKEEDAEGVELDDAVDAEPTPAEPQIPDLNYVKMSIIKQWLDKWKKSKHETWTLLMNYELRLYDAVQELNGVYEQNMGDKVNKFIEITRAHFTEAREAEMDFFEELNDNTLRFYNGFTMGGGILDDIHPDLHPILANKDALVNSTAQSHDVHMLVLDNSEDKIINRTKGRFDSMVHQHDRVERDRDRDVIWEIRTFFDSQEERLLEVIPTLSKDDDSSESDIVLPLKPVDDEQERVKEMERTLPSTIARYKKFSRLILGERTPSLTEFAQEQHDIQPTESELELNIKTASFDDLTNLPPIEFDPAVLENIPEPEIPKVKTAIESLLDELGGSDLAPPSLRMSSKRRSADESYDSDLRRSFRSSYESAGSGGSKEVAAFFQQKHSASSSESSESTVEVVMEDDVRPEDYPGESYPTASGLVRKADLPSDDVLPEGLVVVEEAETDEDESLVDSLIKVSSTPELEVQPDIKESIELIVEEEEEKEELKSITKEIIKEDDLYRDDESFDRRPSWLPEDVNLSVLSPQLVELYKVFPAGSRKNALYETIKKLFQSNLIGPDSVFKEHLDLLVDLAVTDRRFVMEPINLMDEEEMKLARRRRTRIQVFTAPSQDSIALTEEQVCKSVFVDEYHPIEKPPTPVSTEESEVASEYSLTRLTTLEAQSRVSLRIVLEEREAEKLIEEVEEEVSEEEDLGGRKKPKQVVEGDESSAEGEGLEGSEGEDEGEGEGEDDDEEA